MSFDIWTVLLIVYFSLNTWIACYFYGGREKTNAYLCILIDYFLGVFLILYFFLREMIKSILDYTEAKFFYVFYISKKYLPVEVWVDKESNLKL